MTTRKISTKQKILEAAAEIAKESGPAHISLDAVAARAGISKGGLLYHFPSKSKLLEATVEVFLDSFEGMISEREKTKKDNPDSLAEAFIELFMEDHESRRPPPFGILAALAENPAFLNPIRKFNREFLTKMKEKSSDPAAALVIFLAIHGVRSMNLLNVNILCENEYSQLSEKMKSILSGCMTPCEPSISDKIEA